MSGVITIPISRYRKASKLLKAVYLEIAHTEYNLAGGHTPLLAEIGEALKALGIVVDLPPEALYLQNRSPRAKGSPGG